MADGVEHLCESPGLGAGQEGRRREFSQDQGGRDHVEEEQAALRDVGGPREGVGGGEGAEGRGEVGVEEVVAAEVVGVGAAVGLGVEVEVGGDGGGVDVCVDCCAEADLV